MPLKNQIGEGTKTPSGAKTLSKIKSDVWVMKTPDKGEQNGEHGFKGNN